MSSAGYLAGIERERETERERERERDGKFIQSFGKETLMERDTSKI
jgi:hypothetical protein